MNIASYKIGIAVYSRYWDNTDGAKCVVITATTQILASPISYTYVPGDDINRDDLFSLFHMAGIFADKNENKLL